MVNSVYIHIPFCMSICSYCDFCKFFYNEKVVDEYLLALEKEIKQNYKDELIKTIYIGGGTPSSLNYSQLKKLFDIVSIFKKDKSIEFTIECNIDVDDDKIKLFQENGVNRISIGIETINEKLLKTLNRYHTKKDIVKKINYINNIGITNINVDLMYALPEESIDDVKNDLDFVLTLPIKHISAYSLIIEPHTVLYINKVKYIDEDLDYEMYKLISETLNKNDFIHYETSNYALKGYESKHNLVYWNNEHYYGFGIGASGYIKNVRYNNTKSYSNYLNRNYIKETEKLSKNDIIEYELLLGFRKMNGINKKDFFKKYNIKLEQICSELLKKKKLIDDGNNIKINTKYLYVSNQILIEFVGVDYEGKYIS